VLNAPATSSYCGYDSRTHHLANDHRFLMHCTSQQVPLLSHLLPKEQQFVEHAIATAKSGNKPLKLLPSCAVLRELTAKTQQIQQHRSERLAAYKQQKRAAAQIMYY
jgi:hypothetical protein